MNYKTKCDWIDAASKGDFDTEPDIYYFNVGGYSGKFIIDYNQVVHIIPFQFITVTPLMNTDKSINGFIITNPDGIKYTLGVNIDAIEETHVLSINYLAHISNLGTNDYSTSSIDKINPPKERPYYKSGWHLSKIESPVGDEIDLTYKANDIVYVTPQRTSLSYWAGYSFYSYNGITTNSDSYLFRGVFQFLDKKDTVHIEGYQAGEGPWESVEMLNVIPLNNAYCYMFSQSRFEIKQKKLLKITAKNGNYIDFISDNNRPDLSNGLELTGINIYDYNKTLFKSYNLNYSTVVSESYSYPTKNPLSIGEYYYFNKNTDVISGGSGLTPPSEIITHIPKSPFYSSLGNYVGEGLKAYNYNRLFLNSITETNGIQSKPPYLFSYINPERIKRRTAIWVDYYGYNNTDSVDMKQPLGATKTDVYFTTGLDNPDETYPDKYRKARQNHLHVSQSGLLNKIKTPLGGEINCIFEDNKIADDSRYDTFPKPGCRVAKLIKSEGAGSTPLITKYNYSKDKNWYYKPAYKQYRPLYQEHMYTTNGKDYNNPEAIAYKTKVFSSSDLGNTVTTNGSMLGYKRVEVLSMNSADSASLGKEIFTFSIDNDAPGQLSVTPVLSLTTWTGNNLKAENVYRMDSYQRNMFDQIIYPVYDNSFKRGSLLNHLVLDNNGLRLKSTTNTYTSNNQDTVNALNANNFSFLKRNGSNDIIPRREACFYGYPSTWFTLGSVTDTTFEQNNQQKFLVIKKDYSYNSLNGLPTQISTKQSNGLDYDVKIQYYVDNMFKATNYAYDLTDPFTIGIKAMEAKNIRSAVLEKVERCNGKLISGSLIEYGAYLGLNGSNNALPAKIHQLNIAAPIADRNMAYFNTILANGLYRKVLQADPNYKIENYVDLYDAYGNLLQMHKANGQPTSMLWGYNNTLPIAKADNANYFETFYDGFEDDGTWDSNLSTTTFSHTGKKVGIIYNNNGGTTSCHSNRWIIIQSGPKKFKYSGWVYSRCSGVNIYLFMKKTNETGYYSYLDHVSTTVTNQWVFLEKEYDVPTDVSLLNIRLDAIGYGYVYFDDIRLYPSNSQMTNYTYAPFVGMTSVTDANNQVTYYNYDGLGRLKDVRDNNKDFLKQYTYHYQGQDDISKFSPSFVVTKVSNDGKIQFSASDGISAYNTKYSWNFGDGTSGTSSSGTHIFPKLGNYKVSVIISNPEYGSYQLQKDITFSPVNLTAYISYTADGGTLNFSCSDGVGPTVHPSAFYIDFGDVCGGQGPSCTHSYAASGTYTVTLTVSNSFFGVIKTASITVKVTVPGVKLIVSINGPLFRTECDGLPEGLAHLTAEGLDLRQCQVMIIEAYCDDAFSSGWGVDCNVPLQQNTYILPSDAAGADYEYNLPNGGNSSVTFYYQVYYMGHTYLSDSYTAACFKCE